MCVWVVVLVYVEGRKVGRRFLVWVFSVVGSVIELRFFASSCVCRGSLSLY